MGFLQLPVLVVLLASALQVAQSSAQLPVQIRLNSSTNGTTFHIQHSENLPQGSVVANISTFSPGFVLRSTTNSSHGIMQTIPGCTTGHANASFVCLQTVGTVNFEELLPNGRLLMTEVQMGNETDFLSITIQQNVTDVDDPVTVLSSGGVPYVPGSLLRVAVLEEQVASPGGLLDVTAGDEDAGAVGQWSIVSVSPGSGMGSFSVTGGGAGNLTATLHQVGVLSFETAQQYTVRLQVEDVSGGGSTASVDVQVNVTDANEPFALSAASFPVLETARPGQELFALAVLDEDASNTPFGTHEFFLHSTGSGFVHVAANGSVFLRGDASLDMDTVTGGNASLLTSPVFFRVDICDDCAAGGVHVDFSVEIQVVPEDEHVVLPPNPPQLQWHIPENALSAAPVVSFRTRPSDFMDPEGTNVSLQLVRQVVGASSACPAGLFSVMGLQIESMQLQQNTEVDFEILQSCGLHLIFSDKANSAPGTPLPSTLQLLVQVTDQNDAPSLLSHTVSIAENSVVGTCASAAGGSPSTSVSFHGNTCDGFVFTDADGLAAYSGRQPFSLQASDSTYSAGLLQSLFTLNASLGVLTVSDSSMLNFEAFAATSGELHFNVTILDPLGGAFVFDFTVLIEDVNDPPLAPAPPAAFGLPENVTVGSALLPVGAFPLATDEDAGDTLVFQLSSITPQEYLGVINVVNSATGQLQLAGPAGLDHETAPHITVVLNVSDASVITQLTIELDVLDINEPPSLVLVDSTLLVDETPPLGTLLATSLGVNTFATASDPDGDTLQFSIAAASTPAFAINSASGVIQVADSSQLDFEKQAEHWIVVAVFDGTFRVQRNMTVLVNDVNDPPFLTTAPVSFTVQEHAPLGSTVAAFTIQDDDSGDSMFAFHREDWTAIGSNVFFSVVEDAVGSRVFNLQVSGDIDLALAPPRQYKTILAVCDFNCSAVLAADGFVDGNTLVQRASGFIRFAVFDVQILPVAEAPTISSQTFFANENSAAGSLIGVVAAQDPDLDESGTLESLSFQIIGIPTSEAALISLASGTGQLTVAAQTVTYPGAILGLDFERMPAISFIVQVTDRWNLSASATMTLQLYDALEPPVFMQNVLMLPEMSATGAIASQWSTHVNETFVSCQNESAFFEPAAVELQFVDTAFVDVWNTAWHVFERTPNMASASNGSVFNASSQADADFVEIIWSLRELPFAADFVSVPLSSGQGQAWWLNTPLQAQGEIATFGSVNSSIASVTDQATGAPEPAVSFSLQFSQDGAVGAAAPTVQLSMAAGALNAEIRSSYWIGVSFIVNGSLNGSLVAAEHHGILRVQVGDVDEPAAVNVTNFNAPFLPSIKARARPGEVVDDLVFSVSDADAQSLTASITPSGSDPTEYFAFENVTISRQAGEDWPSLRLVVNSPIEFDGLVEMTVSIGHSNSPCRSMLSLPVRVAILDANDAPTWGSNFGNGSIYETAVLENSGAGLLDGAIVNATDDDLCQGLSFTVTGELRNWFQFVPYYINLDECAALSSVNSTVSVPGVAPDMLRDVCQACASFDAGTDRRRISRSAHLRIFNDFLDYEALQSQLYGGYFEIPISVQDEPYLFSPQAERYVLDSTDQAIALDGTLRLQVLDVQEVLEVTSVSAASGDRLSTSGSETIVIQGTGFPSSFAPLPGAALEDLLLVRYKSNLTAGSPEFQATNCRVTVAYTQLTCLSAPGYGLGFSFQVRIGSNAGVYQGMPIFTSAPSVVQLSYARPTVDSLSGPGTENALTAGGQLVTLRGSNFGSQAANRVDQVRYGPSGFDFLARNCSVTVGHSEIQCSTEEGLGTGIRWTVAIAGQLWEQPATTAYGKPQISHVFVNTTDGLLSTAGGDVIVAEGVNFGPLLSPSAFAQVVDEFRYGVASTNPATNASTLVSPFAATGCIVTQAHVRAECRSAPGAGSDFRSQLSIGGQLSQVLDEPGSRLDYRAPSINASRCASMSTAAAMAVRAATAASRGVQLPAASSGTTSFCQAAARGGTQVVLDGSDFGRRQDVLLVAFGGLNPVSFSASGLTIRQEHTQAAYQLPGGNGALHSLAFSVSDRRGPLYMGIGFAVPVLTGLSVSRPRDSDGNIDLRLEGMHFAPCCWRLQSNASTASDATCVCVDAPVTVELHGSGVTDPSQHTPEGTCRVNFLGEVGLETVSETDFLICTTQSTKGLLYVWVGGQSSPSPFAYEYILLLNAPVIFRAEPSTADTQGGAAVSLLGDTFGDTTGSVEFLWSLPNSTLEVPVFLSQAATVLAWSNMNVTISIPQGQGRPTLRLRQFQSGPEKYFDFDGFEYSAPSVRDVKYGQQPTCGFVSPQHIQHSTYSGAGSSGSNLLQIFGTSLGEPLLLAREYADLVISDSTASVASALVAAGPATDAATFIGTQLQSKSDLAFENTILIGGEACLVVSWNSSLIQCAVRAGVGASLDVSLRTHTRVFPANNARFATKASTFVLSSEISEFSVGARAFQYRPPAPAGLYCLRPGVNRTELENAAKAANTQGIMMSLSACKYHSRTTGEQDWAASVVLVGSSFGSADGTVFVGQQTASKIAIWTHNVIVFSPPAGHGLGLAIRVQQGATGTLSSAVSLFSYYPPSVDSIQPVLGSSTQSRLLQTSNVTARAMVTFDARSTRLRIRGSNFGVAAPGSVDADTVMNAKIKVGGLDCSPPPGSSTTYISDSVLECFLEASTVGPKNISIDTVGQSIVLSEFASRLQAVCREGYFGYIAGKDLCVKCPECDRCAVSLQTVASCPGGAASPVAAAGVWRVENFNMNSTLQGSAALFSLQPCFPSEACLSGNRCAEGYRSSDADPNDPCTQCSLGFKRGPGGSVCEPCPSNAGGQAALIAVLAIAISLVAYKLTEYAPTFTGLTMFIDLVQLLAQVGRISLGWIPDMTFMFGSASVFQLNLPSLVSPECAVQIDYDAKWYALMSVPFVMLAGLLVLYGLIATREYCLGKGFQGKKQIPLLMGFFVTFCTFMYVTLVSTTMEALQCTTVGQESRLKAELSFSCSTPQYQVLRFFAYSAAVVYGMGIPAALGWLVYSNGDAIHRCVLLEENAPHILVDPRRNADFGVYTMLYRLYRPFTASRPTWIVATLARKFLIVFITSFIFDDAPAAGAVWSMLVLALFLTLQQKLKPYRDYSPVWRYKKAARLGMLGDDVLYALNNSSTKKKLKVSGLRMRPIGSVRRPGVLSAKVEAPKLADDCTIMPNPLSNADDSPQHLHTTGDQAAAAGVTERPSQHRKLPPPAPRKPKPPHGSPAICRNETNTPVESKPPYSLGVAADTALGVSSRRVAPPPPRRPQRPPGAAGSPLPASTADAPTAVMVAHSTRTASMLNGTRRYSTQPQDIRAYMAKRASQFPAGTAVRSSILCPIATEHNFDSSDEDDPHSAGSVSESLSSSGRSLDLSASVAQHLRGTAVKAPTGRGPSGQSKPQRNLWKANSLQRASGSTSGLRTTAGAGQPILRSAVRSKWGSMASSDTQGETRERASSSFAMANPLRAQQAARSTGVANSDRRSVVNQRNTRTAAPNASGRTLAPLGTSAHTNPLAVHMAPVEQRISRPSTRVRRATLSRRSMAPGHANAGGVLRTRGSGQGLSPDTACLPGLIAADNFHSESPAGLSHALHANAVSQLMTLQGGVEQQQQHPQVHSELLADLPRQIASLPGYDSEASSDSHSSSSDGSGGFTSTRRKNPDTSTILFGGLTLDEFVAQQPGPVTSPGPSGNSRQARLQRMVASKPEARTSPAPENSRRTTAASSRRASRSISNQQADRMRSGLRLSQFRSQARGVLFGDARGDEGGVGAAMPDLQVDNMVSNPLGAAFQGRSPAVARLHKRQSVHRGLRRNTGNAGVTGTLAVPSHIRLVSACPSSESSDEINSFRSAAKVRPTSAERRLAPSAEHKAGAAASRTHNPTHAVQVVPSVFHGVQHELKQTPPVSLKARKEAWKSLLLGWTKVLFRYNDLDSLFSWALLIVVGTGLASFVLTEGAPSSASETATAEAAALTSRDSALAQAYAGLIICVVVGLLGTAIAAMELGMALLFFIWRHHAVRRLGMTAGWLGARERGDLTRMAALARELELGRTARRKAAE